jgi:hypothetical protein
MRYPNVPKEQLTAPATKFRVFGVETDSSADAVFSIGDFNSLDSAKHAAKQKAGTGTPIFIYNDRGEVVVRYGSRHEKEQRRAIQSKSGGSHAAGVTFDWQSGQDALRRTRLMSRNFGLAARCALILNDYAASARRADCWIRAADASP